MVANKQANKHTPALPQHSPASVWLAQARPNKSLLALCPHTLCKHPMNIGTYFYYNNYIAFISRFYGMSTYFAQLHGGFLFVSLHDGLTWCKGSYAWSSKLARR